jgi:hypothetical protein
MSAGAGEVGAPEDVDVTPDMIERGVQKFREWENRFFDPMDGYPPLDSDLRGFLPDLFRHMRSKP